MEELDQRPSVMTEQSPTKFSMAEVSEADEHKEVEDIPPCSLCSGEINMRDEGLECAKCGLTTFCKNCAFSMNREYMCSKCNSEQSVKDISGALIVAN